jgi:hypothetical protein
MLDSGFAQAFYLAGYIDIGRASERTAPLRDQRHSY